MKNEEKINIYCNKTAAIIPYKILTLPFLGQVQYQPPLLLSWRILIGGSTIALEVRVSLFGNPNLSFS